MTVSRSSREAISVVVDPGPAPHGAAWDLELRGPLDPAALDHALDELTAGEPDGARPRHRLLRHGPDHHTVRFAAAQGSTAAAWAGRIADLLTEAPAADRALSPAQCAALAPAGTARYEAVFIETAAALDTAEVRRALRAVLAAHPQLRARPDTAGDRLTGTSPASGTTAAAGTALTFGTADTAAAAAAGTAVPAGGGETGSGGGLEPLVEGEFSDEAGFAAAVASIGRTVDVRRGVQLRALLARDRRRADHTGPRADRLALVAHELAVDDASWQILLDDLAAALGSAARQDAARPQRAPDGLADWVTALRELAGDAAEARHWSAVAERRSRAAAAGRAARPGHPAAAPAHTGDTAPAATETTARTAPAPAPADGTGPGEKAVAPDPDPDRTATEAAAGTGADTTGAGGRPVAPGRAEAAAAAMTPPATGAADETMTATGAGAAHETSARTPTPPATAPATPPAPAPGAGTVPGPGSVVGFTLDQDTTERITEGLAERLALTADQVLTGVFALALARWQDTDEVSLDVRSDPRPGHRGLRRHVGRLTDVHPVHLTLQPGLDPLSRLAAAAGALAASQGQAAGGAGFGACREWSPDPLLRDTLRTLPPARALLDLHGPHETLPDCVHRIPAGAPGRPAHQLTARIQLTGTALHIGLEPAGGHGEDTGAASPAALAELLHDLLTELAAALAVPIPSVFGATPQQAALFTGGDARPGTGRHVEQLVWVWHGPLDLDRFTAAWQSVFDCETVLRTSFTGGPRPQLMVHARVTPDITRRIHRGDDWSPLLERDRLRGFDLRCPGALRLTLLESERAAPAPAPPTRIVLTYHRALLDTWSAHILLREFYRAYLAGGSLPGGERRPDLRDYTAWIAAQDLEPVREFWARAMPPDGAAAGPARPARTTAAPAGVGRTRLRLDSAETLHLARWAGRWGIAESSALQAVWAILVHRAADTDAAAPVRFAVSVSGRGIALDGAARMLGPLRNALPVSVEVDPAGTLADLMRRLRDHALDMAAYEWVPARWSTLPQRRTARTGPADTVIVFEDAPHPVEGLEDELAAQGIRAEFSGTMPARSVLPIGLLAHHDSTGGLVLTGVHDRDVLDDEAAGELLVQSALLLRELPVWADESTTIAEVLKLLQGRAVPRMTDTDTDTDTDTGPGDGAGGRGRALTTLRPARQEQAGTICLIPPPGAGAGCYDLLPHTYPGPQELLVLTTGTGAEDAGPALSAHTAGRPLLLGGFSGAGVLACDIAGRIAAGGGRPPRVVLTGASTGERERSLALARALTDATRPDG
ncbi:condensation domain-containing protein [Streptomyces asoensis]|uniref:condensation domain-containing protein n=1 Tax=Streptomyces asoensis TaxID=249586 RepID=UPI0033E2597F